MAFAWLFFDRIYNLKYFSSQRHQKCFIWPILPVPFISLSNFSMISFKVGPSQIMKTCYSATGSEINTSSISTRTPRRLRWLIIFSIEGTWPICPIPAECPHSNFVQKFLIISHNILFFVFTFCLPSNYYLFIILLNAFWIILKILKWISNCY